MENGEIAEKLLYYKAKKDGVTISLGHARGLGNVAKETGIPLEELIVYTNASLHKLVDELYGPKKEKN